MIRRLRALAPTIILSGGSAIVGMTALAQAAKLDVVTTGEMHRFVIITFLTGAGTVLAGLTVVFAMVTNARDSEMRAAITANTSAVASLAQMFKEHHLDEDAHPAGSAARIDPINEKLDGLAAGQHKIGLKLTKLVAEHSVIRRTELCAMNSINLGRRNPADSPYPRRATDPEDFDAIGLGLRGKGLVEDVREDDELAEGDEP